MTSPPDYSSCDDDKVSLLDLAASALSSAIVAADQITALAYGSSSSSSRPHHEGDGTDSPTAGEDNNYNYEKKNVRLKNDGSFVTDADLAAQQIIVDSLRTVSGKVRIVGEESEEEMKGHAITGHEERSESMFRLALEEILIRYRRSNEPLPLAQSETNGEGHGKHQDSTPNPKEEETDSCDQPEIAKDNDTPVSPSSSLESEYLYDRMEVYEVDPSRVSVFIDPLDGTQAYAKGDYEPVSILIAIILDQTPCFGVICKPFGYRGQTSVLDTGCVAIYGGTLLGAAFTAGGSVCTFPTPSQDEPQPDLREQDPTDSSTATSSTVSTSTSDLPKAVISSSRSQGVVQEFVTHLGDKGMIDPKPLLISGAGEKSLRIILRSENEGLWFFPKAGTSLWDVAASDALLRATGGRLSDKNGNDMDYSKSRTEAENEDGVVACYDQRLHAECIRLFLEGPWHDASAAPPSSA